MLVGCRADSTPASLKQAHQRQPCPPCLPPTLCQDEDWISELVERLWPYIKATAEDMAWQMLPGEPRGHGLCSAVQCGARLPVAPLSCCLSLPAVHMSCAVALCVCTTFSCPTPCPWPLLFPSQTDILEASEPSWIHDINLKKFVLGVREPDISDIRWVGGGGRGGGWLLGVAASWSPRVLVM